MVVKTWWWWYRALQGGGAVTDALLHLPHPALNDRPERTARGLCHQPHLHRPNPLKREGSWRNQRRWLNHRRPPMKNSGTNSWTFRSSCSRSEARWDRKKRKGCVWNSQPCYLNHNHLLECNQDKKCHDDGIEMDFFSVTDRFLVRNINRFTLSTELWIRIV